MTTSSRSNTALSRSRSSLARRISRSAVALGALVASVAGSVPAVAQDAITGEFSVQRFGPAVGPRNYLTTRGVRTDGEMAWSGGMFVNYALKPFVVRSCVSDTDCDSPNAEQPTDINVVENLLTADLMGSLTVIPRLQIGMRVPLTYTEGDGLGQDGRAQNVEGGGISAFALGDAELEAKFRAHGEVNDPFVVGGALVVTAPIAQHLFPSKKGESAYIGDRLPTVGVRGIFDGLEGPLSFGGNLSYFFREKARVGSTTVGQEFQYAVAGGYQVSPVVRAVLDAHGSTRFSSKNGSNTMEADLGVQVRTMGSPITVTAAAGTGVIQGIGVPKVRGILGVMYVNEPMDRDGDGITDANDRCPTEAEDFDKYEDSDGCPDADNDGDTILDDADKCPTEAEDPDGFEDLDGCPEADNDKDGIDDANDRCPLEPETKNGFKDDDGCPDEPDADGDGVPDSKDKCPNEAEDTDGFEDTDGCPDKDNDKDGIPDDEDECVDVPEDGKGDPDDGCPED